MSEKSEVFKKRWACEIHPSCLYCIPCDCNNCKSFELTLKNNARKFNLEKDYQRCKKDLQNHPAE